MLGVYEEERVNKAALQHINKSIGDTVKMRSGFFLWEELGFIMLAAVSGNS